jgi:phosphate transport system substrate-binding protein
MSQGTSSVPPDLDTPAPPRPAGPARLLVPLLALAAFLAAGASAFTHFSALWREAFPESRAAAPPEDARAPTDEVKWVGCDICKASFMDDATRAFEQKTGHKVRVEDGGASRGIQDVCRGDADFGGTCRHCCVELDERGVKLIPIAWDCLVVIVHPDNPVENLSRDQLKALFTGQVRNWREVGGRDAPVEVFCRKGKRSGVGYSARLLVFDNIDQEFQATRTFDSTRPLEDAVEKSPNAVAFTGVNSGQIRAPHRLKMLKVDGREPTRANVIRGDYGLYRPLYLTIPERPHPVVREFLAFLYSREGQAIIRGTRTITLDEGKHLWEKFKAQMQRATRAAQSP